MTYIDEIPKLPLFKTIFIILFIVFSLFPPLAFFYAFDPVLFLKLDFFKLIVLVSGFGLSYVSFNTVLAVCTIVVDPNVDHVSKLKKREGILTFGLFYSILSYVVLYIFTICPDSFIFKVTQIKYAILLLFITSIVIFSVFAALISSIKKDEA